MIYELENESLEKLSERQKGIWTHLYRSKTWLSFSTECNTVNSPNVWHRLQGDNTRDELIREAKVKLMSQSHVEIWNTENRTELRSSRALKAARNKMVQASEKPQSSLMPLKGKLEDVEGRGFLLLI